MVEEKEILLNTFGISTSIYPYELYKTKRGYSVAWKSDITGSENLERFRKGIGFGLKRKRERFSSLTRQGT